MSVTSRRSALRRRNIAIGGITMLTAVMWYAASVQFTGGAVDLAVFAPPGAALGLALVWSAHAFAPNRFTWRRGAVGALVGGVVVGPLVAFLVAFAAAWEPASFQFVFNVGAWLAFAAGLGAGGVSWVLRWLRAWRYSRSTMGGEATAQVASDAAMPDASNGVRPTPQRNRARYPVP